jgi:hypothetical protein
MRRFVLFAAVAAALTGVAQAHAGSFPCGLPDPKPLWVEFSDGSVEWRQAVFGKPGVVVGTNGVERAAEMRSLGAQTIYWHMNLKGVVGTPTAPKDPVDTEQRTNALVDRAIASSGCNTPVIALNELNGVTAQTPWSPLMAQYRGNVLKVMQVIGGRGGVPVLLVPGPPEGAKAPFLEGDAAEWWRQVAASGHIVRELYFNAPYIDRQGPIVGSRMRRTAMRTAVSALTALGIPADRLGIMLGFQSGSGKGGREGLQPSTSWYRIVKQDALSAKQVAAETGVSSIWSWGWGTFTFAPEGADPDKAAAACVYLWARDPALCDGTTAAGPGFDASLTEGQIILPEGALCSIDGDVITQAEVDDLTKVTGGDRAAALRGGLTRVLLERVGGAPADGDVKTAEKAALDRSYAGDSTAYQAELDGLGISRALAQRAVADQLHWQGASALLRVQQPSVAPDVWLRREQKTARQQAICLQDEVPTKGGFDWTSYLPFLALTEPSISAAPDPRAVKPGEPATLSGSVTSDWASEAVTVYVLDQKSRAYTPIAEAKVDKDGAWSVTVTPKGPSTTYLAVSRSAVSKPIAIRVKSKHGPKTRP